MVEIDCLINRSVCMVQVFMEVLCMYVCMYGSSCVSICVYESLWGFIQIYGIIWVCGWLWVLWSSMSVDGSLCASMRVNGSIWKFIGVWINMNSGWVYLYVVYRWYVYVLMGTCEFVRFYGSLWRARCMGPKHPEVPRDTYKYP